MRRVLLLIGLVFSLACQDEALEYGPTEKFNSIFDNPSEGLNYEPLDLIETEDGGLFILSQLANKNIFVIKVSNRGEFIWSEQLLAQFNSPVPDLVEQNGKYYFIAGTVPDFTATLFEIDDLAQNIEAVRTYVGYRRALAFNALTDDSFVMLTYNDTTGTVLSKLQEGFAMEWARRFDEITNAHENLDFFESNNRDDFFVGSFNSGAVIYFNTLRREGLTLTFANDQGIETGKIKGSSRNFVNSVDIGSGAIVAMNYTTNNQSFFINGYSANLQDSVNLQVIGGELVQDRQRDKGAATVSIEIDGLEYILNAFTTNDGRVKLNLYDTRDGRLVAIRYVGGVDPIEVKKIIQMEDGGIAILSAITLSGIKERINLTKISQTELAELL